MSNKISLAELQNCGSSGRDDVDEPTPETNGNGIEKEPARNVGKKYKKWTSSNERNKFYKKLNNGPTIPTRKPTGVEKIYPPIPEEGLILQGYSISQFGRVRLQNGSITTGSNRERATIDFPHYQSFIVSRLVASSFNLLQGKNDHDVDHIDYSRPLNNALSNLQTLTRSDHSKKTHVDHPESRYKTQISLAKPILGRKLGSHEEFTEYISSHEAERQTGVNSANIRTICKKRFENDNNIYQCGGYEWKYGERYMGENEPTDAIWKRLLNQDGSETPHHVCQHGLVRRGDGFITRGTLQSGRYTYGKIQLSILVALHFLPPPTDPAQTSVNHKDLNPMNNHVSNLEWASDLEQVLHSRASNKNRKIGSITKKCRFRNKDSKEWTTCDSIVIASNLTSVSVRSIRKNFLRDNFTEKGFQFREIEEPLLEGEKFVPLRLYYKSPPKARRAVQYLSMLSKRERDVAENEEDVQQDE